jgi:metallo-beta-lactamase family protein
LYDENDIERAMNIWEGIGYHKTLELAGGFSFEFLNSGHILGSGLVRIVRDGKAIIFSGDLGGGNSPLLSEAEVPVGANYLLIESVYGDRIRDKDENRRDELENIIEDSARRGGTLLIPAFSTERTQDLIFEIRVLMTEKRVPSMPVYIDSPLANKITQAFTAYPQYFSPVIQKRIAGGEDIFSFPQLHFVQDAKESAKIGNSAGPKIILAGSGMSAGGRVHGHQKIFLPDPKSTLLIVGYQAAGSLGRRLAEGEKTVRIEGQEVHVRCKVEAMYGYSAHMDGEQLLEFVNKIGRTLQHTFVVMGEPASSAFLVQRIRDYLGINATAPEAGQKAEIDL